MSLINEDPWGLPYKIVLGRLRPASCALTETLDPPIVRALIDGLFPDGLEMDPGTVWTVPFWDDRCTITVEEIRCVMKEGSSNSAPGLDGVPTKILNEVPQEMLERMAECFTVCLRTGNFPRLWKRARLVLIPKGTFPKGETPKVRPICLLMDVAKLLERIVAGRLIAWMAESSDAALSDDQYGFIAGGSTCDALLRLKSTVEMAFQGDGVLAVSLDIENAFNSIPWPTIRKSILRKDFPDYLKRIIDGYLFERWVEYSTSNGVVIRPVIAGVPQSSVLGPLLWNIGYDRVLRGRMEYGCQVICYADETLLLASADTVSTATRRANLQIARILDGIERIGIKVATRKTEAVLISRQKRARSFPVVRVDRDVIKTGSSMKYLGVVVDMRFNFNEHFEKVPKKRVK